MVRYVRAVAVAAACFFAVVAGAAAGAQAQTVVLPHGLYASVDAGVIVPQSISLHSTASGFGVTSNFNGNLNLDAGPATGFILGWNVLPYLAVEGNFEYANVGIRSISGTSTSSGLFSGSTAFNVGLKGNIDAFNGLFNALWRPLGEGNWYGIKPYIGGGVGFSNITETITGASGGAVIVSGGGSTSQTDFAANGIVGFDVDVMPSLSLGARYRFLYVNMSTSTTAPGVTSSTGDFFGHVITANATWHF